MTSLSIYLATAAVVFGLGLGGVFLCAQPLRRILAVNIAGSGVFMLLVALARRASVITTTSNDAPDPVPHALVLTGIVVAISATAVALALLRKLSQPAE